VVEEGPFQDLTLNSISLDCLQGTSRSRLSICSFAWCSGALSTPGRSGDRYHGVGQADRFGLAIHGSRGVQLVRTPDQLAWCYSHSACRQLLGTGDVAACGVCCLPSFPRTGRYYRCSKRDLHGMLFQKSWRSCTFEQARLRA
jgi:hypothetical protein